MTDVMKLDGFIELSRSEMEQVDGGSLIKAIQATAGVVLIAWSPAIGIGAGIVGGPITGAIAAGGVIGLGLNLVGKATH